MLRVLRLISPLAWCAVPRLGIGVNLSGEFGVRNFRRLEGTLAPPPEAGSRFGQQFAEAGGGLIAVEGAGSDGEGQFFPGRAVGCGFNSVQPQENQAGAEGSAFVAVNERMIFA